MVGRPPLHAWEEAAAFLCTVQPHGRLQGGRAGSAATDCKRCCPNLQARLMPGDSAAVLPGAVEIQPHTQGGGCRLRLPLL